MKNWNILLTDVFMFCIEIYTLLDSSICFENPGGKNHSLIL